MLEVLCNLAWSEQDAAGVEDQRSFGTGVLLVERDWLIDQFQALSTSLNDLDGAMWRHEDAHESWRSWVARELLAVLMVAPETGFSVKALLRELPWLESMAPVPMQGNMTVARWYELVECTLVVGFWLPVLAGATGRRLRVDVAVAREDKAIPNWLETPSTPAVLQESKARANIVLCASGMSRPWTVLMDHRLPPVVDRSASLGLALAVWAANEAASGRCQAARELETGTAVTGELGTGNPPEVHRVEGLPRKAAACVHLAQLIFPACQAGDLPDTGQAAVALRPADTLLQAQKHLDDRYDLVRAPVNLPNPIDWMLCAVSDQIIPLVQAFCDIRPSHAILFHSDRSCPSAGRLRDLLTSPAFAYPGTSIQLAPLAHDDFAKALENLKQACADRCDGNTRAVVNFTGGNKIMTMAFQRLAMDRGWPLVYREIGQPHPRAYMVITWDGQEPRVSPGVAMERGPDINRLDPLEWIQSQSAWTILHPGQTLALHGLTGPSDSRWFRLLHNGREAVSQHLLADGKPVICKVEGDYLEYFIGMALLGQGISLIRKGVKLGRKDSKGAYHDQEHDLVFVHGGKLWLVDCKDRPSVRDRALSWWKSISRELTNTERKYKDFMIIISDLEFSERQVLLRDAFNARVLGLTTQVLIVRRSTLGGVATEFAHEAGMKILENVLGQRDLPQSLSHILGSE